MVTGEAKLHRVADTCESKCGPRLTAPEGTWSGLGDAIRDAIAVVYRVAPSKVLGFGKGTKFSQTRWRFPRL